MKKNAKKNYLNNSIFINRFVNLLIRKGRKIQFEKITEKIIFLFKENFYFIFSILIYKILFKLFIILKLVKKQIAGKLYYFPAPLHYLRQYYSAFYTFLKELKKKYYRDFKKSFILYLFDFSFKFNLLVVKQKTDLYNQAVEHGINVHFRWEM